MTDLIPPDRLNTPAPQTLDLLLTRRSGSAKAMTAPGPDAEQLRTILTAATRVPDHGKLTPWRFITFTGEARGRFGHGMFPRESRDDFIPLRKPLPKPDDNT